MQPEARVSRRIIQHVMARDGYAYKVHGGPFTPAGTPDVSAVYRSFSVWFETKMPGNQPSAIQLYRHEQLRKAGGIVSVPYSLAEARAVLDRIDAALERQLTPAAISAALNAWAITMLAKRLAKHDG
jgi:hypothetical protein